MIERDTTNNKDFGKIFLLAGTIAIIIAIMFASSCNSAKKSTKLFNKALTKDRVSTAGNCAKAFPYKIETSEKTNIIYLKGDSIIKHDTTTQTINNQVIKTITKTIYKTDTLRRDSIVIINADGGPELAQCQYLLEQATKDKQKAIEDKIKTEMNEKNAKSARNHWIIAFVVLLLLFIGPKIIKYFIA